MEDDSFKVKTYIDKSSIPGTGRGRFFDEFVPKGTIVRVQEIDSPQLLMFSNIDNLKRVELKTMFNYCHSVPIGCNYHIDKVFLNYPPMMSNHSMYANVRYTFTETHKYCIASRNIEPGEELLQNYTQFSKVEWYEDYLHKLGHISVREFGNLYK